ncbi:15787_t:CDS:1, partial [Racocetra persica]
NCIQDKTGNMKSGKNIGLEFCDKNKIEIEKNKYKVVKESVRYNETEKLIMTDRFDNSDIRSEKQFEKIVQEIEGDMDNSIKSSKQSSIVEECKVNKDRKNKNNKPNEIVNTAIINLHKQAKKKKKTYFCLVINWPERSNV